MDYIITDAYTIGEYIVANMTDEEFNDFMIDCYVDEFES